MKKVVSVRFLVGAALLCALGAPRAARAGGYEFGANGTEILGRGGTFTAKADSPAAVDYNVAGIARLRGTRLLIDANILMHDYSFTRSGVYPSAEPAGSAAPWVGQPFPQVSNSGGPFFAPMLGLTTDFGYFDRWTFGISLFGPSSYGKRTYPTAMPNGFPGPQRYDLVKEDLLIVYPTISAAVRVTRWFELGMNLQIVVGHFNLGNITSLAVPGCPNDPNSETPQCDSGINLDVTGASATAALGALFHPVRGLDIGLHVRGPVFLSAEGTVNATSPPILPMTISPDKATFKTKLPWIVRLGLRYAFKDAEGFEKGDIELDGTYEAWKDAQGQGDQIIIPSLSVFTNIRATIRHNYKDTFSLRLGGAYNAKLPRGVLSVRAGIMYDSAATDPEYTRLDFDTMDKIIPTVGLGYRIRGVTIEAAYAYVWEPSRNVLNGQIHALDGATGADKDIVINNGYYQASTHVVSVGLTIAWDEALKRQRTVRWQ